MFSIRCNELEKERLIVLLDKCRGDNSKKRNMDVVIESLQVYEKYQEMKRQKIEKATAEIWGD